MIRVRIRESALHVAKQFALEQRLCYGTGINGHHRLLTAKAPGVNLPRQDILAGTVLAGNEHRGIRGGNLIDGLLDHSHST